MAKIRREKPKFLFVVRQFIVAKDATEAIRMSKKTNVHEVWVDEDFRKSQQYPKDAIGFTHDYPEES